MAEIESRMAEIEVRQIKEEIDGVVGILLLENEINTRNDMENFIRLNGKGFVVRHVFEIVGEKKAQKVKDVKVFIAYCYEKRLPGYKACLKKYNRNNIVMPVFREEPATNEVEEEEYIEPAMDVEEEEYVAMNEVEDEDNISDVSSQNSVENNNENIEMNVVDDDNQYDELDRQFIRANIQLNISYSLIAAAQAQTSAAMAQYAAAYAQLELLRTRVAVERDRM